MERPGRTPGAPEAAPSVGNEIAGSLSSFVRAVRSGTVPDGEVHGNVMSLTMVDAAIASARTGRRIVIDEVLEQAHATAVADEQDPAIRERLTAWGSVPRRAGRARSGGHLTPRGTAELQSSTASRATRPTSGREARCRLAPRLPSVAQRVSAG